MQPTYAHYFAHQHGLILRRQALAAGLPPERVRSLLRSGEWVRVRTGVYTTRAHWESLDRYVGRPTLEVWAATLVMRTPHLISHDSAAYLHGLPILEARPRRVHVTRPGHLGGSTKHGIQHHQAPVAIEQIEFVDDWPVLDLPRTVADIGREHGIRHAIVATNAALSRGVSRRSIQAAIRPMRNWPNVTIPRLAAEWGDGRCETPGEDLTMLMLKELALGPVHAQFGLREGRRKAWVDLRVGRHLIEFDGKVKYQREEVGGLAGARPEDVLWEEKRRQDWLCGFKLGMSRVVWEDLQPPLWAATKARLHREILDTTARFGTSIGDLRPYLIPPHRRRPRPR